MAEDEPLHPALTPQAIAGLKLKGGGEPLSTLLPKLAALYDYDVQPSGKVFLLKKRYTDAADLPSVTVKECVLGLAEASRYAENFNPHFSPGNVENNPPIRDLIYSLTPEQLEAMKDIKRGVPVASLSPAQQQEVQQFVLHIWIQMPSDNLPATVGALNRVAATDPQFSQRDYPQFHTRLFGYDATLAGGQRIFVTMSKIDQIQSSLDGGMRISPRMEGGVPQVAGYLAPGDLTDPLTVPANAPPPAPSVSASLADILARLNARADDGLKVTVEPYLAPKRATAFGEAWATPRQEMDALADVYGLRVFKDDPVGGHDRLRLTRRTGAVPLNVVALHTAILQALPDPLVRACRMHSAFAPFNPEAPSPIPSGLSPLLVYAVRQIRAAAEPKIRASRDGKVALSSLSEREGRAFAVTLMADPMETLRDWTTADPPGK